MPSLLKHIVCRDCGEQQAADLLKATCDHCGSTWLLSVYDTTAARDIWLSSDLQQREPSLWRYEELLPLDNPGPDVSMGEGSTPLVRAARLQKELQINYLWIKDERQNPTGCFKDRQAVMNVALFARENIPEVVLASTGNKATAFAAYCARAGIRPWIFLTSMVPNEKLRELGLYGSEVVKIAGTYDQAKKVASDFAARRDLIIEHGARSVLSQDGMKTIAFEIAEQLARYVPTEDGRWQVPDWYIQSVSGGIGPISVWQGFKELYAMGMIDRLPKIGVVQVEGCAPMVEAWERNAEEADPVVPHTRISVLATGDPGRTYQLLRTACIDGGGTMVAVNDGDTFRAMRRMARVEGISMEPATAVAFAGLEKLVNQGIIQPDDRVVVNCSGHTFPAEKHVLEDQYVLDLQLGQQEAQGAESATHIEEGLESALANLDEQVTTVVIIDDNPQDSRLIRRLLQSQRNYRVFEINDPRDALELIKQRKPDLIVCDLTMPDMDGFELLSALKSNHITREIPVVIVSAKTLSPDERNELESKANSLWQKGNFNTRELVDHVVQTLGEEQDDPQEPLAPPSAPASSPRPQQSTTQVVQHVDAGTILVIDDNRRDARLVRRILEATKRYHVTEAYSAEEALTLLPQEQPDLIVLDVLLPDIHGTELLSQMKQTYDFSALPVVVLTAHELSIDERKAFEEQGCTIWYKLSLDRQQLVDHVDRLLQHKNS